MSIDQNAEVLIDNEHSVLKDLLANCNRERARLDLESSAPTQEENNTELLIALKKQYDENLTEEQKDALIIYNSQFFALLGEISNVEDFENTDNLEILKHIEQSPIYEEMITSLHAYCMTKVGNALGAHGDIESEPIITRIFEKVLPGETASKFLKYIKIDSSINQKEIPHSNNPDFSNLMCDLIGRLKQAIQTIQDIPQDAIVLPEDITVYRGIDSMYLRNPQCPSKGAFISTSLRPEIAMRFGGNQPAIYKILLREGTPVKILPQKVYSEMGIYRRVADADPADSNGTKEILLCTDNMQDFEITESISSITHYKFENGEFIESKSGFIITGEMEPKIKQQIRTEADIEQVI